MKCVVILSGGPDSVTTAYWAKAEGYKLYTLTFDYGQKAHIEIEKATWFADHLDAKYKVIDISNISEIYKGVSSLTDSTLTVSQEFSDDIIVPFRNGIFMAVTVAYADALDAGHIFYGAHGSDEEFYPDCRREFYEAFQEAARLGTEKQITIAAPFNEVPKSEILKTASRLGVPLEKTWSCYLEGPIHCGRCESCNNRKKAFKESEISDPTEYMY